MEPIVIATWGLVVATLGLVVVTWLQGQRQERESKTQADRENAQLASLREQSAALAATARASQSMADEMRQARIAALTFAEGPSYPPKGDLLVARVTGRPANGEEQSSEFRYRILPDRTAEDLSVIQPLAEWG
jgi:hypothetical protein